MRVPTESGDEAGHWSGADDAPVTVKLTQASPELGAVTTGCTVSPH